MVFGVDVDKLWDGAKNTVENAWSDFVAVGVPALSAAAQKQGLDALNKMYANTQNTLQDNVKSILQRPTEPGSFGATLADEFKTPFLKQYGPMIAVGAVGLVVIGVLLSRR